MAFKTFANNDLLTASDVNTYLARQSVIICADSTARSAIPSPVEGMTIYREDIDAYETYTGSAWVNKMTRAKVGTFTCPSSTGNNSVTGVGFTPKIVRFTVVPTSGSTTNSLSNQGSMDAAGNQWAIANASRHGVSESDTSALDTTKCLKSTSQSAGAAYGVDIVAAYVSMDSDGFTMNFTTTSNSYSVMWEAIG